MNERNDQDEDLERLRNLPVRSEEIGFSVDAMIPCTKCGRANAPTRAECLYCGSRLEASTAEPKLDLRELDARENGFNLIVTSRSDGDTGVIAKDVVTILQGSGTDTIRDLIESGKSVPIARVESESVAGAIADRLAKLGIETRLIPDESLLPSTAPVRLRGLAFTTDELILFEFAGQTRSIRSDDLALLVSGVLVEARTDSVEKRKRKTNMTVSESPTVSDEVVIDLYAKGDSTGWRIWPTGFDFSCLGAEKSMLATDNMAGVVGRFRQFYADVKVNEDYKGVRPLLEHCWPSESRRDSKGLQRSGFVRSGLASAYITNNALQLLKYSRLQWHLL